jgi:hypothetical protein
LELSELDTLGAIADGFLLRQARLGETATEIVKGFLRNRDAKRPDVGIGSLGSGGVGGC